MRLANSANDLFTEVISESDPAECAVLAVLVKG